MNLLNAVIAAKEVTTILEPIALGMFIGGIATWCIFKFAKTMLIDVIGKPIWNIVSYKSRKNKAKQIELAKTYETLRASRKEDIESYYMKQCTQAEALDMLIYVTMQAKKRNTVNNNDIKEVLEKVVVDHPLKIVKLEQKPKQPIMPI